MATIALVSGQLVGATPNVNVSALLTDKGHTPTFFDQSAVTAGNLSAFALIYVNLPDVADSAFEGFIRDYMRVDNIPVLVAGMDDTGTHTDSLVTALGIAQSIDGSATEDQSEAAVQVVTGFEDLQVIAGNDPEFPITVGDASNDGFKVTAGTKHKGTPLLTYADDSAVAMFQAESTDTDFTDTSLTLGARFVWVGWVFDDVVTRDAGSLINAALNWLLSAGTFDFPTTGNNLAIARPVDLDRLVTYQTTSVDWTQITPGATTVQGQDSQDELASFTNITNGGEISGGFVITDPISGDIFLRWNLVAESANTPEVNTVILTLEGESPALRQLGATTAPDHDPTVLAEDEWYTGGLVTFLDGENEGLSMEVRKWINGTRALELFLPMNFPIAVGDTFTIYPGCNKTIAACRDKFDNVVNFRGEPFVPGNDQLFRTPDVPSS